MRTSALIDLAHYGMVLVSGLLAGIANTVAGGGSLIAVPALILLGLSPTDANATSRPAIVAQNLVAWFRLRNGGAFKEPGAERHAWSDAFITLPSALFGAWIAAFWTSDILFRRLFAVVLIAVLALSIRRSSPRRDGLSAGPGWLRLPIMVGIGFYGGFIQAGVGFLIMAALFASTNWTTARITAEKIIVVGLYTVAVLLIFHRADRITWGPALVLAAAQAVGGFVGARLTLEVGEPLLRKIYFVLLAVFCVALLI